MKKILNKLDTLNNKKPKLNAVFAVLALVALFCCKTALVMLTPDWYAPTILGSCFFTAVFILLVFRNKSVDITKSSIFIIATEAVVGFSFLLNGYAYRVKAYLFIGAMFIVLMPVMHLALAKFDREKLMLRLCMGLAVSYIILLTVNMFRGPVLVKFQFGSIMGNSNSLGYFMAVVITALTYLLIKKKDTSFKNKAICWGLLISALSMLVFTSSRTSVLALFFCMGYLLITAFISRDKTAKRAFKKKHVIVIVVITIAVPFIMFFMLSTVRKEIIILKHKLFSNTSSSSSSNDNLDDLDADSDFNLDYYVKGLDGEGEDSFTSGRILIWKAFVKNVAFVGHQSEHRVVREETRIYDHAKSHNSYLQVAYNAGFVAGAAYLAVIVFIGVKALILFFGSVAKKKKHDLEVLLGYGFFIIFAIVSLTSDGYMLFDHFPVLLFWLTAHNYIFKEKKNEQDEPEYTQASVEAAAE